MHIHMEGGEFDAFTLLSDGVEQDTASILAPLLHAPEEKLIPDAMMPIPQPCEAAPCRVMPQTVLLSEVRAAPEDGGLLFNSCNLHAYAPFRAHGDGVRVDPSWWASLAPEHRTLITSAVAVTVGATEIGVPHAEEVRTHAACGALYSAFTAGYSFAYWRLMQPAAQLVELSTSDRGVLEAVAMRHAYGGGRALDADDIDGMRPALLRALTAAIDAVGGEAFVKTAEKSAKNDTRLVPHATAASALQELTSSEDVLRQSLAGGRAGERARYLVVQPWAHGVGAHNEWRLIVRGGRVCGISQQSWRRFVGHDASSAAIAAKTLLTWWYERLAPLSPYVDCIVDAYIDNASGRAHLIEVNACGWWGAAGNGLFHYARDDELLSDPQLLPVRVVVDTADAHTLHLGGSTDGDGE